MANIHVLDRHTAELIAAGEVVERPSSVVKELIENSIDAGASSVCVEIENGGVSLIKVSDNGSGILREDVPTAFMRHATSKLHGSDDLDSIGTLGFRGEALASVCAVARVELLTRTAGEMAGTRYLIEGGEEILIEDAACPQGTTIIVRDLFYNVPARMKFLKKDVTEANSVAAVVDCIALSHPEVSFRLLRDGREELLTPGDGKLQSCIYTVFGRDFSDGMLPVDYSLHGIRVHGFVCKPSSGRANRTMQHFFVNRRYVKTRTAMAALEQAFKGLMMTGRFPSCVLHIELPFETVDVNVHPAKIEVRFINERPVFDAVYHAVKSALQTDKVAVPMKIPAAKEPEAPVQTRLNLGTAPTARAAAAGLAERNIPEPPAKPSFRQAQGQTDSFKPAAVSGALLRDRGEIPYNRPVNIPDIFCDTDETEDRPKERETTGAIGQAAPKPDEAAETQAPQITYIGEAFSTYIIVQTQDSLFLIDKHAAHERILYEELISSGYNDAQMLLEPVSVPLSREEYAALLPELETLNKAGFEAEDFGGSVLVRALPMMLDSEDAASLIQEIAGGFASGRREITADKLDWIYHSSACRAAVKAGDISKPAELMAIAQRVLQNRDIRTCPHGRPVCFELTRHEIEKQFGRTK
jgi:DNA mismatch repair protein MutL